MPKRLNRAIELLEDGQPLYFADAEEVSYEGGRQMARTWGDYIRIEAEHAPFEMSALGSFMRGLVDGGPTSSGHRTPPVLVSVPADGANEEVVKANAWMFKQVLSRGVHGVILCHAETPGAVRAFVESCRFSFQTLGVGAGLDQGRRGHGGEPFASDIWGVSIDEYLRKADVWPLNPDGEIMLGVKIENVRALANAEPSARVPGLAYAEWGVGDMTMSFGYPNAHDPPYPKEIVQARERVKAACRESGVNFLDVVSPDTVVDRIEEGVMIGSGGQAGEETARIGRAYTKRTMPV